MRPAPGAVRGTASPRPAAMLPAILTLACNLLADVLYAVVDPRVRIA